MQIQRKVQHNAVIFAVLVTIGGGISTSPAAAQFGGLKDAARKAAEAATRKSGESKAPPTSPTPAAQPPAASAPQPTSTPPAAAPAAPAPPAAAPAANSTQPASAQSPAAPSFQAYSKYDFVPGEKIIAMEDFSQDATGDFPAKWNTDASGEVVTIAGQQGRWLKLTRAGWFTPDFITELPENVTVEFDLAVPPNSAGGFPLETALVELKDLKRPADWQTGRNVFIVTSHPSASDGASAVSSRQDDASGAANNTRTPQLAAQRGAPVHISMWRQRQRVRVYMNEEKIWDLPRTVAVSAKFNSLVFFVRGGCGNCEYYIGNLRVATGAPDTRNKILTEGKWVTHGILFDVNSDRIKAESYGSLKEIAGVLAENTGLKVTIVGHTDSDGDDALNLDLSKRRAASVKTALVSEFKIDAGRLATDGKGESQPVDKNDSPAGKANNRRVEFIKQ